MLEPRTSLTENDIIRYSRHILLPEIGGRGQLHLLSSSVKVMGSDVASEEAAVYLAAAGIGQLLLTPALTSTLHGRLQKLNPDVDVASEGNAHLVVPEPSPKHQRAAGALAALTALVALLRENAPLSNTYREYTASCARR